MKKFNFTKMVGSGNDFVVIQGRSCADLSKLARIVCDRRLGIGADGMLVIEKSKKADLGMRIFNADGSEAKMCGNGARCAALFSGRKILKLATGAGIVHAQVKGNCAKIQITEPKNIRLDLPLKINQRSIKANFIDTGVPHAVIFVDGIQKIDVQNLGKIIRNHAKFSPQGANVNFVQVLAPDLIQIRTYERGVEGETLACGTGSTASALIFALKNQLNNLIKVKTQSGEVLKIYFKRNNASFKEVWLEGSARIVYKGEYYV